MQDRSVILIAEDEEDYVLLLKRAFAEANIPNPIFSVATGRDAISYLKGENAYSRRDEYPLPDLLLLDLKLPGFSGLEILRWLRTQPTLLGLHVMVLTSSEQLNDVNDSYRLGANTFLMKPYDFEDLVHLAKVIQQYWLYLSQCGDGLPQSKGQALSAVFTPAKTMSN